MLKKKVNKPNEVKEVKEVKKVEEMKEVKKVKKVKNTVYVQHFGEEIKIERKFPVGDKKERYVYQISHQDTTYILKGFKIELKQLRPKDEETIESFKKSLLQISEAFREFHISRAASLLNPHIAAPLFLDFEVEFPEDDVSCSYMNIQIIFEHGGTPLDQLRPIGIELTYNLMKQSAHALSLLHKFGIAHLDIKPSNMVYDEDKKLLKIVDMGSAFVRPNQKTFGVTNFEGEVRSITKEFAPPEVLSMDQNSNSELILPPIDVYYWGMSFFALMTLMTDKDITNFKNCNRVSREDHKKFKKIVETNIDSVNTENDNEKGLKRIIKTLVKKALRYKVNKRVKFERLTNMMEKFEEKSKRQIRSSKKEYECNREFLSTYTLDDEVSSFSKTFYAHNEEDKTNRIQERDITSEQISTTLESTMSTDNVTIVENFNTEYNSKCKEEPKLKEDKSEEEIKKEGEMIELNCGHEVNKDHLIHYALNLFIKEKSYEYCCWCETCKKVEKIKYIPLYCDCTWAISIEKVKFNNDLTEADYGQCSKDHPLTCIDLGLLNDFISVKFTSLMISDYSKEKKELVNSFNEAIKKESVENILWIFRYTNVITKLDLGSRDLKGKDARAIGSTLRDNTTLTNLNLSSNYIDAEDTKVIVEALKMNNTLTELDLSNNEIGDEGTKEISELLKVNTKLKELNISYNNIEVNGAKEIGEALKVNRTLTKLNLCKNNIGGKTDTILGKLYSYMNNTRDEGVRAICKALRTNTALTELRLSSNNIGDEGIKIICKVLKVNTTLKKLYLEKNDLGVEGYKLLWQPDKDKRIHY